MRERTPTVSAVRLPAHGAHVASGRPSVAQAAGRAIEAGHALARSEAALWRRDVELRIGSGLLGLALSCLAGIFLAAAWTLAVMAAVTAAPDVPLPTRLGIVAAVHALVGVGLVVVRKGIRRG